MDGRCRTCRHWYRELPQNERPDRPEGWCYITLVHQNVPSSPGSLAMGNAMLFEDSHRMVNIWLATSPDFGCIQWEAKTD
jgi:hypothetical protein